MQVPTGKVEEVGILSSIAAFTPAGVTALAVSVPVVASEVVANSTTPAVDSDALLAAGAKATIAEAILAGLTTLSVVPTPASQVACS